MSESPYMTGIRTFDWELETAKAEVTTLQLAVTVLKTENEILEGKVAEREKKIEKLTTEFERINKRLQDSHKIYIANEKEYKERVEFLESEVEHAGKELRERIRYLESQLESSGEQVLLRESALEVKERELKDKEKELEKREKECERVKDFFAAGNDMSDLLLDLQGRVKKQEGELSVKEEQIVSLRVKLERAEQERLAIQQTFLNQSKEKETSSKARPRSVSQGSPVTKRKRNHSIRLQPLPPEPSRQQQRWSQPVMEDRPPPTLDRIYDDPILDTPDYKKLDWEPSCTIDTRRKIVDGAAVYSQREQSLYFSSMLQRDILIYRGDKSWEYVPSCPHEFFGLVLVEDNVTAVGGKIRERLSSASEASIESQTRLRPTNKLLSFIGGSKMGEGQWVELYPPMPTKRSRASAICTSYWLIVAGGDDDSYTPTVEVMNLGEKKWYRAAILPKTLAHPQMVLSESTNRIYITGEDLVSKEQAIYNCTIGELLATKEADEERPEEEARIYEAEPFYTPSPMMLKASKVWKELQNIPLVSSALAIVNGQLMVAGGVDATKNISNEIYSYNTSRNEWEPVAHMPTARLKAVMGYNGSSGKVVILGGFNRMGPISTVDIANVKQ